MREVKAGSSYLSQSDLRVHFGMGQAARADGLEIRWPSGAVETVKDVEANQILTITEGRGVTRTYAVSSLTCVRDHVLEPHLRGSSILIALAAAQMPSRDAACPRPSRNWKKADVLESIQQFKEIVRANPADGSAYFYLSTLYTQMDEYAVAERYLSAPWNSIRGRERTIINSD